jgi:hypothetical protein
LNRIGEISRQSQEKKVEQQTYELHQAVVRQKPSGVLTGGGRQDATHTLLSLLCRQLRDEGGAGGGLQVGLENVQDFGRFVGQRL